MKYSCKRFLIALAVIFGAQAHAMTDPGFIEVINNTDFQSNIHLHFDDTGISRQVLAVEKGERKGRKFRIINFNNRKPVLGEVNLVLEGGVTHIMPSEQNKAFNIDNDSVITIDQTGPETFEYTLRRPAGFMTKGAL